MSKLKLFLTIVVIGISAFTHLYRIDKTFIFQNDEGRDALIAYRMIETRSPVLLGPETSVGNMYLGPFYYFLMVPALSLSSLDPVGPAVMVAILGIATTGLLILLGKKHFNFPTGLYAGIFYSLSPVMVHYSRSSWNPNVIPFFTILLFFCIPFRKLKHLLAFGALTGIIFQLHYVALIIPTILIIRELYLSFNLESSKALMVKICWIILGFLITSAPFWLFELRHEFINSQAFLDYLMSKSSGGDSSGYPPYFMRLWGNIKLLVLGIIGSSALIDQSVSWIVWATGGLTILLYWLRHKGVYTYVVIFSLLIISILKENINVHYVAYLFPIVSLMIGRMLSEKGITKIPTLILVFALIAPFSSSLKYNLFDLESSSAKRAKETAEYIVKEAAEKSYNVVNYSTSSTATILYYLATSTNPPKNDDQPLLFVICEDALCSEDVLTTKNLFLNGPSHPTLISYLGYHPRLSTENQRTMVKNEWVTYDVHVATVMVNPW